MIRETLLLAAVLSALVARAVYAAGDFSSPPPPPAPEQHQIAIDRATKACMNYWGGDEFNSYPLGKGWEAYPPVLDPASAAIETALGACKMTLEDFSGRNMPMAKWSKCLSSLRCAQVEYEDFDERLRELLAKAHSCKKPTGNDTWGIALAVDAKNKKCAFTTCDGSRIYTHKEKFSLGLELHTRPQDYVKFETKAGVCVVKEERDGDYSDCCRQLGYRLVRNRTRPVKSGR